MLSLKNVTVRYDGVQAVKKISIDVEKGSITGLIGANGAGKSTTLKAISGLVPLTSGEIWFEGQRIDGKVPEKIVELGIGHVPEGKQLFLDMSVLDNLLTGAHLRRDEDKLQEASNKYADNVIQAWKDKIQYKLGAIDNAECKKLTGMSFLITGTKHGKEVRIEQQVIVNRSKHGLLFNQFPARINYDGKAISERRFKELVKGVEA